MKTLVAIILALGVGFAAAYVMVSKPKEAPAPVKVEPKVVAAAPEPVEKIVTIAAPAGPVEASPAEILEDLVNIKLGSGNARNAGLRMVIYKLETLSQRGPAAVPAIRTFIARSVDVDYSQQQDNSTTNTNQADANGGNNGGNNRRNRNGNNAGFGGGNGGGFAGGFGGNRGGARRARNLETLSANWVAPPSCAWGWSAP
ncbi:MAG: hypothetical protein WDN00_14030 [Limisphaerales bacterium]